MRKIALLAVVVAAAMAIPLGVYASHQFTDVPDSNVFHNAIDWMKDNAITVGCNPPVNDQYCPGDSVTRGQMAAFMKRLSEKEVVNAATAVNATNATNADDADLLDGLDSTELIPILAAQANQTGNLSSAARVETNSVTIDAPVDGVLMISGSVFVNHGGVALSMGLFPKVDGTLFLGNAASGWSALKWAAANGAEVGELFTLSYSVSTAVSAGVHTVSQEVGPTLGTSSLFFNKAHLNVVFVPGGQAAITAVGATTMGDGTE